VNFIGLLPRDRISEPAADERKSLLLLGLAVVCLPFSVAFFFIRWLPWVDRDGELLRVVQTLVTHRLIVLSYTRNFGCRQLTNVLCQGRRILKFRGKLITTSIPIGQFGRKFPTV